MLTNLLPGLRELRTPLAIGYTLLFTLWLVVHDHMPERDAASGIVADLYTLAETLGRPIVLGALTFVAYIIGATVRVPAAILLDCIYALTRGHFGDWVTKPGSDTLKWYLRATLKNIPAYEQDRDAKTKELMDAIKGESDQLAIRLQITHPEDPGGHDRTVAEADYRVGMGVSLIPLIFVLTFKYHPLMLLLLVCPALLITRGCMRFRGSNDVLVQALSKSRIDSPSVSRFKEE